jgi:hypothetical protein
MEKQKDAACTCSIVIHLGHAARLSSNDLQREHGVWTRNMNMHQGHAARACSVDMQQVHAAWTCRADIQHRNEARRCSMDNRHGCAGCTVKWLFKKITLTVKYNF